MASSEGGKEEGKVEVIAMVDETRCICDVCGIKSQCPKMEIIKEQFDKNQARCGNCEYAQQGCTGRNWAKERDLKCKLKSGDRTMRIGCNTPGCVTKEGMNPMVNPGSNKQVYRCSRCGGEILIFEDSPQGQIPLSAEDEGKDARICACCKRSLPEDVDICFQCVGYSHFEPKQDDVDGAVARG